MKYQWIDYTKEYAALIDGWLDDEAIRFTGIDSGWDDFYEYWKNDSEMSLGENYWCKLISYEGVPFAAIAFSLWEGKFTVMEYIVDPKKRGCGLGSSALKELMDCGCDIIRKSIERAEAVIFPKNMSSQKAFAKAGFKFTSVHPDGDALYYTYEK